MARLDDEARLHAQTAELLWAAEDRALRIRHVNDVLARVDPLEVVEMQREKAALIVVEQAQRLDVELGLKAEARRGYEQAIRFFPNTRWAIMARQRLERMESGKEG